MRGVELGEEKGGKCPRTLKVVGGRFDREVECGHQGMSQDLEAIEEWICEEDLSPQCQGVATKGLALTEEADVIGSRVNRRCSWSEDHGGV